MSTWASRACAGLLLVAGCGRLGFEANELGPGADATTGPHPPPVDGNPAASDAISDDAAPAIGCAGDLHPRAWGFSSDLAGWYFDPDIGFTTQYRWTSEYGNPAPGAMEIDIGGATGTQAKLGWLRAPGPFGDLRGRIGSIRLWTSSSNVRVKLYAQNMDFSWADGGTRNVPVGEWICLRLDIDAPVFTDPTFDPTQVEKFGVQIDGIPPVHVIVDDAGY